MKKMKRIFALAGAVLMAGMYLITLVLSLSANPASKGWLMASIACTIVVPSLLYGIMLIARILDNRSRKDNEEDV